MLWLEIPAYAGSTRTSATPTGTAPDHPRIRGEHGPGRCASGALSGLSPHTRGAHGDAALRRHRRGIIPAYAGSTPFSLFPFDTNNSTRVGAPCQALRVCSQPHFRVPYDTVGYLPVGSGGRPSAYVGVSYPAVTYDYVGVAYAMVTYPRVSFAYVTVTYHGVTYLPVTFFSVTYHGVTYTYVAVTYGYVGKSWH